MMEENNNIFLAGCDDLIYLALAMHKKYSTTFVWGHPIFQPLSPLYSFRVTVSAVGLFQKILLNTIANIY